MSIRRFAGQLIAVLSMTACNDGATDVGLAVQVLLSPDSATVQQGQTQQLTATVNGLTAGQTAGVDFTSSAATIATVDPSGLVRGVAPGTATITATSKADSRARATARVTVTQVQLAIAITSIVSAGTGQPVDPQSVSDSIKVGLRVTMPPGGTGTIEVRVGSKLLFTRDLVSPAAARVTVASAFATSAAQDVQQIECQINTSSFNAQTGVADVLNGLQPLTAEVFFRPQGAAAGTQTQRASISQQLTISNQSGFFANVTNTPTTQQAAVDADGQATGPNGVLWRAGSINVIVLPVNFAPPGPNAAATFTITLRDANSVIATGTDNTPADGFNVNFAADQAPPAGVAGVSAANVAVNATATSAGGANVPVRFLNGNTTLAIDNVSPDAGPFTPSAFINGSFNFASLTPPAFASQQASNPDFGGVNRVTVQFFAGPTTSNMTAVNKASDLAATTSNTAYNLAVDLIDALGNYRRTHADKRVGYDPNSPVITVDGSAAFLVTHGRINPPFNSDYKYAVTDAHSGLQSVTAAITSVAPGGAISCALGQFSAQLNACVELPAGASQLPVPSAPGFHTLSITATDVAQNVSKTSVGIIQDVIAPQLGAHTLQAGQLGGPTTLSVQATDNLSLRAINARQCYNLNGTATCIGVAQFVASAFGAPLVPTANPTFNFNFTPAMELTTATGAPAGTLFDADRLVIDAIDHANLTAFRTITFGASELGPRGPSFGARGVQQIQITSPGTDTYIGIGGADAPICPAGVPTSITFELTAQLTAGAQNPFTGVSFDMTDAQGVSRNLGQTSSFTNAGNSVVARITLSENAAGFSGTPVLTNVRRFAVATAHSGTGGLRSQSIGLLPCRRS
jgi:hypothetical protein